ncbi:MAG: hypothetical protein EHM24_21480, partial [Acidobacteria bacterium]
RPEPEVRALWVARTSLTSPAAVTSMVEAARAGGFNTLLVQVRGRGDAYFSDGLEPRAAALAGQPESFDPLAATLTLAHRLRLRVHAWVNVNLVSSAVDLPADRSHVVFRRPEWLMVPRPLAREMVLLEPRSLLYLEKLTRWMRSQSSEVEGLYVSPVPEESQDRTVSVLADLVARYPIDGLHLDYVRYPNDDFDYGRESLLAFRADVLDALDDAARARYQRAVGTDLVGWTEAFPERWRTFRRDRLTTLVARVRQSARVRRPGMTISAAVYPDAAEATTRRLQDWRGWLDRGLLDVVCPMAYATDVTGFTEQMAAARQGAGGSPMWAGIGAYRLSPSQTIENIHVARRLGAAGIVLYSYDSIVSPPNGPAYLSHVSRAAFGG